MMNLYSAQKDVDRRQAEARDAATMARIAREGRMQLRAEQRPAGGGWRVLQLRRS